MADALREVPVVNKPTPDIAIVNPGGLRAELLFPADLGTSAVNTDGVVTFEEFLAERGA